MEPYLEPMDLQSVSNKNPYDCFIKPHPKKQEHVFLNDCFDMSSRQGKFGWATINRVNFPYILRGAEKYVAVRMINALLIDKYTYRLSSDIYINIRINAHFITKSEAKLLNEINKVHLDEAFGKKKFRSNDLITELEETIKLYTFLHVCYEGVNHLRLSPKSNCGFIQVGSRILPYININYGKYVPSLFFNCITESLKSKCVIVESWDWAYLRFYCNISGLKQYQFPSKSCPVINVAEIEHLLNEKQDQKFFRPFVIKDTSILFKSKNAEYVPWYVVPKDSSNEFL